jgi:hypothetical protein
MLGILKIKHFEPGRCEDYGKLALPIKNIISNLIQEESLFSSKLQNNNIPW